MPEQAYAGAPDSFAASFDRNFAGRSVVIGGKAEERSGAAYRDSTLTFSYMVFSPSGAPVPVCFDGPFFERYRLKSGMDVLVKAVLGRMYLDPGAVGENGRWVIVLDSAKSALVTDTAQLKGLGWKSDDETENLVASQRSLSPAF